MNLRPTKETAAPDVTLFDRIAMAFLGGILALILGTALWWALGAQIGVIPFAIVLGLSFTVALLGFSFRLGPLTSVISWMIKILRWW
jgi:hypothetical protein